MTPKPKPIEDTIAWPIYRMMIGYCTAKHMIPSENGFWRLASSKFPSLTITQYRYAFKRLCKEGYIVQKVGGLHFTELTIVPCYNTARLDYLVDRIVEYVYILTWGAGIYKIGLTNSIQNRTMQLGILLPFKVDCIHKIETYDARSVERILHRKYADRRLNGEWFRLSDQDIEDIKHMEFENGASS